MLLQVALCKFAENLAFGTAMVYTVYRLATVEVRDEKTRCVCSGIGRGPGGYAGLQCSAA